MDSKKLKVGTLGGRMANEIETNEERKSYLNVHMVLICDVSSAEGTRADYR